MREEGTKHHSVPEEAFGTKAKVIGTMAEVAGTMAVAVIGRRAVEEVGRKREVGESAPPHEGPSGSKCWRPTFQLAVPVRC